MVHSKYLKNVEIDQKNNLLRAKFDISIYPLDIVYRALYSFMDDFAIVMGYDVDKKLLVEMVSFSDNVDLNEFSLKLNNEILSFLNYYSHKRENSDFKKAMILSILKKNFPADFNSKEENLSDDDIDAIFEEFEKESGVKSDITDDECNDEELRIG